MGGNFECSLCQIDIICQFTSEFLRKSQIRTLVYQGL